MIDAVALLPTMEGLPAGLRATPLHCACFNENWDAALALLAAGARVDIAGHMDDRLQKPQSGPAAALPASTVE
jgi:hypothetical protein